MKENEAEGEEIEKNMNGVKNRIEVRERGSMLAGRKVRETRKRVQASAADETTDARYWVVEEWEKERGEKDRKERKHSKRTKKEEKESPIADTHNESTKATQVRESKANSRQERKVKERKKR